MAEKIIVDFEIKGTEKAQTEISKLGGAFSNFEKELTRNRKAVKLVDEATDGAASTLIDYKDNVEGGFKALKTIHKALQNFTLYQKAAAVATRIFNAVMAANPIGLIILAVTSLIAAGYALIKMFQASSEATANVNAELDKQEEALNRVEEAQDKANKKMADAQKHQIALMKAQGKTTEEIRKQERANAANTIAMAEAEVASNKLLKAEQERALWLAKDNGDEEQIERAEANLKKSQDILKKSIQDKNKAHEERIQLTKRYEIEDAQIITNSEKQKAQSRKASDDKATADKKKAEEEKAAALEAIRVAEIDTEDEKRKEELRKVEEQYTKLIAAAKKYNQDTDELKAAQKTKEDELRAKFAEQDKARQDKIDQDKKDKELKDQEEKIAKLELDKDNENLSFEDQRELINQREALLKSDQLLSDEQKLELKKQFSEATKKIDKEEADFKKEQTEEVIGLLGNLQSVVGQQTVAGKALGIATATINTFQGASEALKQESTLPSPFDVVAKIANVASVLATGFKTVKSITSVKIPSVKGVSGGGGGGGSVPTIQPQVPNINIVGATETNQLADVIGEQTQQPIQAYVVANDVTTAQSLNNNIVEGASIG